MNYKSTSIRIVAIIVAILSFSMFITACSFVTPVIEASEVSVATEVIVETEPVVETTEVITEPTEPAEPEFLDFSPDITFTAESVEKDGLRPYALFTPSSASDETESALIVWLHGMGEIGWKADYYTNNAEFPTIMNNWESDGFNAYVLCPILVGSHWCGDRNEGELRAIIEDFVATHNVDTDRIYLTGVSLGGQGTVYHSAAMADVFAKSVAISSYPSQMDYNDIAIPMRVYVGSGSGEDERCIKFTYDYMAPIVGEDHCFTLPTGHNNMPEYLFAMDEDGNGRADIIEWMFSDAT